MIIIFVVFIDQVIDYPINCASPSKYGNIFFKLRLGLRDLDGRDGPDHVVTFTVLRNEEPPLFFNQIYRVTIDEDVTPGFSVETVSASDADTNVSYLSFIWASTWHITKTYLYNFDHLKPLFYIVKLGFTGVYIIFLIYAQKYRLWVLVRTTSVRWF